MGKKFDEIWKKNKREFLGGIAVSLATAFIMKAGEWFVTTAPAMGNSFLGTVKNWIFSCAATQSSLNIFAVIILWGLGLFIGVSLTSILDFISLFKKQKKLKKALEALCSNNNEPERHDGLKADKILNELSKIKDKDTTDIEKDVTKAGKLVAVLVIWTALFVGYILLFVYLPLNMLDTFQRNITEITPYSDEATIHQLESDWVCMRSENEYKEIYKVINKIKQEHDLP